MSQPVPLEGRDLLRRLWVLMATVGIDMIGFLIVLPLLPFYAEKLGASPFLIGGMISVFALAQLASAPFWGRVSDRYGRRPVILGSLLVSAGAFVLFESADTIPLLFLSRLVQGVGGGTVAVVQAYLSDSVPPDQRAKGLGWITAASSAGVMLGPAIGSLAASLDLLGPGYIAAILCLGNFVFGYYWLPEPTAPAEAQPEVTTVSQPKAADERETSATRAAVQGQPANQRSTFDLYWEVIRAPLGRLGSLVWIYASTMMAFMASNAILALFFAREFGVTEETIGWFYVYVGAISLVVRGVFLGWAIERFGEVRALKMGQFFVAAGLVTLTLAPSLWTLALVAPLMPIGTALVFPATTSLLSAVAPKGQTGLVLGVQQSFGGLSRMVGPLWAGWAFQTWGPRSPFLIAAGLVLLFRVFSSVVVDLRVEKSIPAKAAPDPDVR